MKAFAFCAAAVLLGTAYAQEPFDPFPNGSAGYHLDFTRIFATAETERADRAALASRSPLALRAASAGRGGMTALIEARGVSRSFVVGSDLFAQTRDFGYVGYQA